jgi:predicted branched-subunit amino acid permease
MAAPREGGLAGAQSEIWCRTIFIWAQTALDDLQPSSTAQAFADARPPDDHPGAPAWAAGASKREAFVQGLAVAFQVPALILGATGAGFGALAHDAGMGFGHTSFMSIVLYATPAQVVLVDQFARGASLLGGAFAVTLTAIRLLPMMVTLMPYLRGPDVPRWQYVLAAHYIAITGWTEAFRRLPLLPPGLRMPHFLGLGTSLMVCLTAGTMAGFVLAGVVPPLLTSALLFMTPLYFTMSLILGVRQPADWAALVAGAIAGPICYLAAPGFDLLLTGLIGGTIAFWFSQRAGGRRA